MYNTVLWSGSCLPLPGATDTPRQHEGWTPLYSSRTGLPAFWWLLFDRFNCFWREAGTPIFVVDRLTALPRADSRFLLLKDIFEEHQRHAWQLFRQTLDDCPGQLFNVELSGLWHIKFQANTEHFETFKQSCLLPFDTPQAGWQWLSLKRKQMLCAALLSSSPDQGHPLAGHRVMTLRESLEPTPEASTLTNRG